MSALFWTLCLAHLLGDYPLQTDRLAAAKKSWGGLTVHVAIHLAVLVILVGGALSVLWPYLLILAAVHFAIDAFKNRMNLARPQSVVGLYLLDQFLHLLSLIGVTLWVGATGVLVGATVTFLLPETWTILGCGLVFVTFMWGITERIFYHKALGFVAEATAQKWPRMAVRGLLYGLFVTIGLAAFAPTPVATMAIVIPYFSGVYRQRALISDVTMALATAATVLFLLLSPFAP